MSRNTRILGVQIKDSDVTTLQLANSAVTADKLATDSVITVKILDANVTEPKLATNSVSTNKIVDSNVTEPKLDINTPAGSGVDGYVLYWNQSAGKLDYKSATAGFVADTDVVFNEVANETPDGVEVEFTHDFDAANGTVMLTLNGLLQQPGIGKDYTYDAPSKTATFITAPETGDIVLFNYVKASE